MNIKLTVKGSIPPGKNFLLVGNHLGFIDIYTLASIRPTLFITSTDMQATPVIGQICDLGGCLYVNRKSRSGLHKEIEQIRQALVQGNDVVLYPEAKATWGDKVYPFKKSLMTAAAGTVPILPMVINFIKINGEPMSHKWRDYVFWHDDVSLIGIVWRAYGLKSIEVELEFLQPIICETEEQRREVSSQAQSLIESRYTPIPYPDGWQKPTTKANLQAPV